MSGVLSGSLIEFLRHQWELDGVSVVLIGSLMEFLRYYVGVFLWYGVQWELTLVSDAIS